MHRLVKSYKLKVPLGRTLWSRPPLQPVLGRVTFSNFLGHSTAPYQFEVEGAFALYFWPTYFFLGCFFSSEVVVSPEFSMFYGIVYRNQVISTL